MVQNLWKRFLIFTFVISGMSRGACAHYKRWLQLLYTFPITQIDDVVSKSWIKIQGIEFDCSSTIAYQGKLLVITPYSAIEPWSHCNLAQESRSTILLDHHCLCPGSRVGRVSNPGTHSSSAFEGPSRRVGAFSG